MSIPKDFQARAGLLNDRVILITGASGGLGKALSIECARAGATVILCGRSQPKLERVYDEIESLGAPQPAIAKLDLDTATAVVRAYGGLIKAAMREWVERDQLSEAQVRAVLTETLVALAESVLPRV